MKRVFASVIVAGSMMAAPAFGDEDCASAKGDVVIAARTPQVDLYDAAMGKRVITLDQDKFPACAPIVARAGNMMLQVDVNGTRYWVPPYMVKYRFAGNLPQAQSSARRRRVPGARREVPWQTRRHVRRRSEERRVGKEC